MNRLLIVPLALVVMVLGFAIVIFATRRIRRGKLPEWLVLPVAIVVILAVSVGFYLTAAGSNDDPANDPNTPAREARLLGSSNLTVPPQSGNSYLAKYSWQASGGLTATATLTEGAELRSAPIFARSSEQFHVSYTMSGSGESQAVCLWEDEGHADGRPGDRALGNEEGRWTAAGKLVYLTCIAPYSTAAPYQVANLRVIIRQRGGTATLGNVRIASDNVHVQPWPNGAKAALAFSFDWESAMGGPIHSRGMTQHDLASANAEGANMRKGADFLARLFAANKISATFYATGYDLLDGNPQRTNYLGNPTYKWASQKNGWASDYWLAHGWYSDDPFSTASEASGANWYFGDQADRLKAMGQEIASHTFGHLYVRGASPAELDADLTQWQTAAAARGITATTFAFPWRSSNSTKQDYYAILRKHGLNAVTRLYEPDVRYPFHFGTAPNSDGMVVVPDFLLGRGSQEEQSSSGGEQGNTVAGVAQAKQVIDANLALGGITSFWNHPSVLTEPAIAQVWQQTVQYAVSERDAGELYVAPVGELGSYHAATHEVVTALRARRPTATGYDLIFEASNYSDRDLPGLTLSFDGTVTSVSLTQRVERKDVPLNGVATTRGNLLILKNLPSKADYAITVSVQQ